MTTLNEEELRKAFDYFISKSPSPLVAMIDQDDAFIGFKAAFIPDVLNSLGVVICDSTNIGWASENAYFCPGNPKPTTDKGWFPVYAIKEPSK